MTNKLKYTKLFLLLPLALLLALSTYGQTFTTAQDGIWNHSSTWVGGNIPDMGWGNKVVNVLHNVTSTSGLSVGGTVNLIVDGNLTVQGAINMWSSPVISGAGSITTTGNFTVVGSMNFQGDLTSGGTFTVQGANFTSGGIISVANNFYGNNSPTIVLNGPLTTGTNLTQNGGSFTANAPVSVGTYLVSQSNATMVFNSTLTVGTYVTQNGGSITYNDETDVGTTIQVNGNGSMTVNDDLSAGSNVVLNSSTLTISSNSSLSSTGNMTMNGSSSTTNDGTLVSDDLTVNGGTITNSGYVETNGDYTMWGAATFTNTSGSSTHNVDGNFTSSGTYENNGSTSVGGNLVNSSPNTIENNGDFTVAGDLNNTGNIVNNGNLLVDGDLNNGSGTIQGDGYICSSDYENDPASGDHTGIDANQDICGESGPLPVKLLAFDVQNQGSLLWVRWMTATETNNSHYTIEIAVNNLEFTPVRQIKGNGNSNQAIAYSSSINLEETGVIYVRLRQTDYDGKNKVLGIKRIRINADESLLVYPNPAVAGESIYIENIDNAEVSIYDIQGRRVYNAFSWGKLKVETSGFDAGVYLMQITSEGATRTQRLIVR